MKRAMIEFRPMNETRTLMARLLLRLSGWLRCRIIDGNDGRPYLERYHLFRLPGGGGVYLHRFLASDPDRGLHDHPWRRALGLVLSGGYDELRLKGDQVCSRHLGPGRLNAISGSDFHRIVLRGGGETWTLFAHGGKVKGWGFLQLGQDGRRHFIDHEQASREPAHEQWWRHAPRGRHVARRRV